MIYVRTNSVIVKVNLIAIYYHEDGNQFFFLLNMQLFFLFWTVI